ncbi:sialoadhesin-like [Brachyhypopomus gauderio]|uniref:sialoadhesin-like n=1 Tax=Brachyhypopomus gauderio TaxID=698409 RepID=UPI004042EA88
MCSSTCVLSNNPTYIWFRNGQPVSNHNTRDLRVYDSSDGAGSYSCAIRGHEELRSPAVCASKDSDQNCWSVTYSVSTICALIGSSLDLHSYFTFPNNKKVTKSFWFVNWSGAEPVDVKQEEGYYGRVQYRQNSQNTCSMTLTHLRESDARTYMFRFYTDDPTGKLTGEPGVTLSVTGLTVTVSDGRGVKNLMCNSTCPLSNNPTYIWFRNGQPVSNHNTRDLRVSDSSDGAGSYSCAIRGHEELRSPAVCVSKDSDQNCWSVTYSVSTICALIGSSLDLHSYFTFPNNKKVTKSFWFINWSGAKTVDVKQEEGYYGRVQYRQNSQNTCSMTLTHLRESDARTYMFRFYTDDPTGKLTGEPGVTLSVTGLTVTVSDGRGVKNLMCSSTCPLSNNPTYIWFRNGQRMSDCTSVSCSVPADRCTDRYSCGVEGHENITSPAVYPPRNTSAVVVPSGERVEGGSVTLTCSSDANPPVLNYSWFKQRAAADTLLGTGQNYSITNISSQHSGLYYCAAHNQLGQHNSTAALLDVLYSPRNTSAVVVPSGERVEGGSVTLTCSSDANPPVLNYSWFKQRAAADTLLGTGQNYSITNIISQHSGLYYCTAHNQLGQHNSIAALLDVLCRCSLLYPPRVPSVTDRVSGDLITLLCYSDSNPNSTYTWYRKTGSDVIPIGNGTSLTLNGSTVGPFYCEAKNLFGSTNSTEWPFKSEVELQLPGADVRRTV